jgi:hypothetical protein
MFLRHTSGEATEVRNQQVLGDDSPLEFEEDGYAEVDDERGEMLLTMHRHIERGGHGPQTDDEGEAEEAEDVDEDAGFDAEAFVDRTPMDDVVDDIEAGEADGHLDGVEAAEEADRDRNGVMDAIEDRRDEA